MELSKVEHAKLDKAKETFNTQTLTKEQAELILGRELNQRWNRVSDIDPRPDPTRTPVTRDPG